MTYIFDILLCIKPNKIVSYRHEGLPSYIIQCHPSWHGPTNISRNWHESTKLLGITGSKTVRLLYFRTSQLNEKNNIHVLKYYQMVSSNTWCKPALQKKRGQWNEIRNRYIKSNYSLIIDKCILYGVDSSRSKDIL